MIDTASRGRPTKTLLSAANEAARIIDIALMIKLGRLAQLEALGFTEATALRYVMKRRRGLTGAYVGTTAIELLGSTQNKTQAALRLIIEHGFPATFSARAYQIDRRNLLKLLPEARKVAAAEVMRRRSFSQTPSTVNILSYPPAPDTAPSIFLPKNTTA
ncbi:MAG: hypothetical protein ACYC4S_12310 [Rhodoferax sp.]